MGAVIDTCAVNDASQPFETGIEHPGYNNGKWIIVEQYDSKAEALLGHSRCVEVFKSSLPTKLVDVSDCGIASLCEMVGGNREYPLETLN